MAEGKNNQGAPAPPPSRIVNITTPPELTAALEGICKNVGKLAAAQRAESNTRREVIATPMRVELINQKSSVFWGVMASLIFISLIAIFVLMLNIWRTIPTTTVTPNQMSKTFTEDVATKSELATVTKLGATKNDLAEVKKEFESKIVSTKNDLKKEAVAAVIDEIKKTIPQNPVKEVAAVPTATWRVNILLVDEYGRVPDCFKGVRVSDITTNGKHTHFLFDGKPIDWNQKVVFSYSYRDGDPPITGAIYYTPEIAGAAVKVINVPPCNVYQDSDGTIRYDDLNGGFPLAPKGAGYITTQSALPTQL